MKQWPLCSDFNVDPYPGSLVTAPSVIVGGRVISLEVESGRLRQRQGPWLADVLHGLDIDPLRLVPLLTYGSNACPGRLVEKFGHGPRGLRQLDGIALIPVVMRGAAIAWSCQPSRRGALPYTLASDPSGAHSAHLLLVPPDLMGDMDRSEGRAGSFYVAARLTDVTTELPSGQQWSQPLAYVGVGERGPLLVEGRVVTPEDTPEWMARAATLAGTACDGEARLPRMRVVPKGLSLNEAVAPTGNDEVIFDLVRAA